MNKNKSHPGVAGRKPIKIDYETLEYLCEIHCTKKEIQNILKISKNTLEKKIKERYCDDEGNPMNFTTFFNKYSAEGKASLRRYQYTTAKNSAVMQIWLGKNWLGQSDKAELTDRIVSLEKFAKAILNSTTFRKGNDNKEKTLSQYGHNNETK